MPRSFPIVRSSRPSPAAEFIQSDFNRTMSYACHFTSTAEVDCTATGGYRQASGPSSTIVTPLALTWGPFTGTEASAQFAPVSIATDSSLLLTYTPAGALVTGLTTLSTWRYFSDGNGSDALITAKPTSLARTTTSVTSASPTSSIATTASSIVVSLSMETGTSSTAASSTNAKTGGAKVAKMGVREAFGTVIAVFLALNIF